MGFSYLGLSPACATKEVEVVLDPAIDLAVNPDFTSSPWCGPGGLPISGRFLLYNTELWTPTPPGVSKSRSARSQDSEILFFLLNFPFP